MKYDEIMMKSMGYSLLIIPIVIPFSPLIMLQGTGQHKTSFKMPRQKDLDPGPPLQWMQLTLIRISSPSLMVTNLNFMFCFLIMHNIHTHTHTPLHVHNILIV